MTYQDLIYSVDEGIATITLNRPARMNALSPNLETELHRAFDEADADRAARVIILTGSGAAFCAGFDQGANKSGRRNSDPSGKSIAMFVAGDQLLKGAALNAVQIAEAMVARGYLQKARA